MSERSNTAVPADFPGVSPDEGGRGAASDADFAELRREVNLLGHTLGHAIRSLGGERLYDLEERVRALTKRLRQDPQQEDEAALRRLIAELSLAEAGGLTRAFSTYLHLVNVAEERHRVRLNRALKVRCGQGAPRLESCGALVAELRRSGLSFEEVVRLLDHLELHLTFTAPPTETRRRTLRHHLAHVQSALDACDEEELRAHVSLMWSTSDLRRHRPSVEDEVEGGLYYLPTVLWNVVPRLVDALEQAVECHYGRRPRLAPPVVFRSWIGGDRDGNPNVTPAATCRAQEFARQTAVRAFVADVDELIRDLSLSKEQVTFPADVLAAIDARTKGLSLPDRWTDEPFRRLGMAMRHRLRALIGEQSPPGLLSDRPSQLFRTSCA